ncbi:hypothetical protein ACO1J2_20585 (plasmid) [Leptospira interrogans serovar Grippotyphosa]
MIFCNPQKNENVSDLLLSLRVLQELYPSGSNSGNASGGSITAPASGG